MFTNLLNADANFLSWLSLPLSFDRFARGRTGSVAPKDKWRSYRNCALELHLQKQILNFVTLVGCQLSQACWHQQSQMSQSELKLLGLWSEEAIESLAVQLTLIHATSCFRALFWWQGSQVIFCPASQQRNKFISIVNINFVIQCNKINKYKRWNKTVIVQHLSCWL